MESGTPRGGSPPGPAGLLYGYVAAVVTVAAGVLALATLRVPAVVGSNAVVFWLLTGCAVLVAQLPSALAADPASPASDQPSPASGQPSPAPEAGTTFRPAVCLTFAVLIGYSFPAAALAQLVVVLVTSIEARHPVWRSALDGGRYVLCLGAAGLVLRAFGVPAVLTNGPYPQDLSPVRVGGVLVAGLAWLLVDRVLAALSDRLETGAGRRPATGMPGSLATGALLLQAPLVVAAASVSPATVPLLVLPLLTAAHLARAYRIPLRHARLDALTGLPNRRAFIEELVDRAAGTTRSTTGPDRPPTTPAGPASMALLMLDVNRFRQVNDALGHAVGDRLLTEVARRLRACVRPEDLVARLGGDEFAVLATGLPDPAAARGVAERVSAALTEPVVMNGLPLDVSASIGVAVHPQHGADVETLLRRADMAMYDAKHVGSPVEVYSTGSGLTSLERLELLADLRHAVRSPVTGGLSVYYQPQVELSTGRVVGVEALLRWNDARRGPVDPEELIRVAEPTTVMRLLTRRVIDDVVEQLGKWRAHGLVLRASVNVSSRDLLLGELVEQLSARLGENDIAADQIQIEITESAVLPDSRRALVTLHRLAGLGIALSLDDFGTGYSSLQHLRRLPLAEVKIDRSFVLGMAAHANDAAIVQSTIDLGRALGLRVVAEGVENDQTRRMLDGGGCEVVQGWYYARPMPADDLAGWLTRYRPLPPAPAPQISSTV